MSQLLHDIAVDSDEPVAADNPLRQVIVATHSPYFVQLQSPEEIVLAKNTAVKAASGPTVWPLRCYPLQGSWRDTTDPEDDTATSNCIGKIELQSYLTPPEDAHFIFPAEFWPEDYWQNT